MNQINLRHMVDSDWHEVAELIYVSTNYWYETHAMAPAFSGGPGATKLFCKVYEALDPGCCILAENSVTSRIMGSCFYHPRETHVSLGIMNVHPNYSGSGVARRLLQFIIETADQQRKPIRLVSSAMNLDSYSLYTRAGFVPRAAFQDMILKVPETGISRKTDELDRVRPAALSDVHKIIELEKSISHIHRRKDYEYFINNRAGIWNTSVYESERGQIEGFIASVNHPGSNMLGPGFARTEDQALALIISELNQHKGRSPVFLVPVDCQRVVAACYAIGARNCELHFCQVRGEFQSFKGVVMPTFMPETG